MTDVEPVPTASAPSQRGQGTAPGCTLPLPGHCLASIPPGRRIETESSFFSVWLQEQERPAGKGGPSCGRGQQHGGAAGRSTPHSAPPCLSRPCSGREKQENLLDLTASVLQTVRNISRTSRKPCCEGFELSSATEQERMVRDPLQP